MPTFDRTTEQLLQIKRDHFPETERAVEIDDSGGYPSLFEAKSFDMMSLALDFENDGREHEKAIAMNAALDACRLAKRDTLTEDDWEKFLKGLDPALVDYEAE
jgi:hypothetical protein